MASKYLQPSFFIVGERKCGTSSLYRYLLDHPAILPCKVKEPQFFSRSWWHRARHFAEYKALFPPIGSDMPLTLHWYILDDQGKVVQKQIRYDRGLSDVEITGEASANTYYEVPPERLKGAFPTLKAIVLFRDPVERAWSHYRMFQRFKAEGRRLPFALTDFLSDAAREISNYRRGRRTYFVGQGVYTDRLARWQETFGQNLFVGFAEDLGKRETAVGLLDDLTGLLGVGEHDFTGILEQRFNEANEREPNAEAVGLLREFYFEHNVRLKELLKRDLPWYE